MISMKNLFLIFGVLIAILFQNKKFRLIFDVYWNQFRRWRNPKLIKNQNELFQKKHVESAKFIRNLHFSDRGYARLTSAQADELNKYFKQCYKVPDALTVLPYTVTILLPQPAFASYNYFFGDCYYTNDADPFYVYETQNQIVGRYNNQKLFVCFADTERGPVPVHMCYQRCFLELLKDYNYIRAILIKVLLVILILCATAFTIYYILTSIFSTSE